MMRLKIMRIKDEYSFGEGYCYGKFLSRKNVKKFGKKGLKMNDAIAVRSLRYALDDSLKVTKKGRVLNSDSRDFYYGMVYGIHSNPDSDKNK